MTGMKSTINSQEELIMLAVRKLDKRSCVKLVERAVGEACGVQHHGDSTKMVLYRLRDEGLLKTEEIPHGERVRLQGKGRSASVRFRVTAAGESALRDYLHDLKKLVIARSRLGGDT